MPESVLSPIIVPGHVVSRRDGDRHYIGIGALCRLYGLRTDQVIPYRRSSDLDRKDRIVLEPSADGSYYNFVERYGVPRG